MKAVIPAAGFGRLRPLTHARPTPALPVAGRPIVRIAVDRLLEVGIDRIGVVVSDTTEGPLRAALSDVPGAHLSFLRQGRTRGLGHAVLSAEEWAGQEDLCVFLGDHLFEHGPEALMRNFQQSGASAALALCEVDDPRSFGVAELLGDHVESLEEKPERPRTNLAVAGLYCFRPCIFEALRAVPPGPRGEILLTDAVQHLIEDGHVVYGHRQAGWWKDTGRPADLLEANRLLLDGLARDVRGEVQISTLHGPVVIEPGARVYRSLIVGPALIAVDAVIEDAVVGPHTSIGRGAQVRRSAVRGSIVDEHAEIVDLYRGLEGSIIGQHARVTGTPQPGLPRSGAHRFLLPDASELSLASD